MKKKMSSGLLFLAVVAAISFAAVQAFACYQWTGPKYPESSGNVSLCSKTINWNVGIAQADGWPGSKTNAVSSGTYKLGGDAWCYDLLGNWRYINPGWKDAPNSAVAACPWGFGVYASYFAVETP